MRKTAAIMAVLLLAGVTTFVAQGRGGFGGGGGRGGGRFSQIPIAPNTPYDESNEAYTIGVNDIIYGMTH